MENHIQRPNLLTAKELASISRVHLSTIYRLAKSGELKSYLIGGRRLFKEEDFWEFFENQRDRGYVFGKEI